MIASSKREATISLREITAETLRDVTNLQVASEQQEYVASNAVSIAEAYFHPEAWFPGIYADDIPVGFVMLEDWSNVAGRQDPPPIFLWRFMIDKRFQGLGYGAKALRLVVDHVNSKSSQESFGTSCVPGPHSPEGFYVKFGFEQTGACDGVEKILRLPL